MICLTLFGIIFYLYRLYKLPNCLFRMDSTNTSRLCLWAIYSGFVGPIKSVYYALRYNGLSNAWVVFTHLFLTFDNPITIGLVLGGAWIIFTKIVSLNFGSLIFTKIISLKLTNPNSFDIQ